jgi:hypothetical protein
MSEQIDNGGAMRFNGGKARWDLVDFDALLPLVQVLEFGAQKYAAHNWKKGLYFCGIINSLLRHVYAILRGEDNDPESNLPHVGHIMCNIMFLSWMMQNKPELDDRVKCSSKNNN